MASKSWDEFQAQAASVDGEQIVGFGEIDPAEFDEVTSPIPIIALPSSNTQVRPALENGPLPTQENLQIHVAGFIFFLASSQGSVSAGIAPTRTWQLRAAILLIRSQWLSP